MRKCLYASAAVAIAVLAAGCGSGSGKSESGKKETGSSRRYAELRWGMLVFPGAIDFTRSPTTAVQVESLTVNSLMEIGPRGQVEPGLAKSVEQPNPTTYIYHLKAVKFSDGRPLTAADVVFSLLRNIHSNEAWDKAYWEDVASIAEQNSSTVAIKLKRPSAVFERIVAFSSQVIEKAAATQVSEKELGTPGHLLVGTGPWMIDSYRPEVSVRLSPNPYWMGAPRAAQKITVDLFKSEASIALALRSGAIDGTFDYQEPKLFESIPGVRQLTAPGNTITYVSANTMLPPFNDVHVRRAIAYATDTSGMINAIYKAGGAVQEPTIVPANLFADLGTQRQFNAALVKLPKYEFDLVKAKQELAKSHYSRGFSTEIEAEQGTSEVSLAEILSADLAKIKIHAPVRELSSNDDTSVVYGGKTKLVVNWITAIYPDPEGIMSTLLSPANINPPGSGLNSANYRNAEVDSLLSRSIEITDPAKRLQRIIKLLTIMGNEAPYWPLLTHAAFAALSEKYVMSNFSAWEFGAWALNVKLAS